MTLLDGDHVRKHLSSELGFSREHRDLNILRIGYVASEITKNGGIAICAPIAPYTATRRAVREMIEAFGAFVETHVATSIEECERRDRKGLYKLAREGKIKEFTGISDPYEAPTNAELVVDTDVAKVSVVGIGMFGFTLSWDEIARTTQAIGDVNTLPLELQGLTTTVTTPSIYALGTVTMVVSFLVMGLAVGLSTLLAKRQQAKRDT